MSISGRKLRCPKLPPIHNFWVIRDKKQGDKDQERILWAIGAALTSWEQVESRLADLFTIFVECPSDAAHRAYGSIIAHKTRCGMLIRASEIYFRRHGIKETAIDFFRLLMRHCMDHASVIRNNIAHGVSMELGQRSGRIKADGSFGKPRYSWYGWFLTPPFYNTNRRHALLKEYVDEFSFFMNKYRYTSADLISFGKKFELLRDAAAQYCEFLDPSRRFPRMIAEPGDLRPTRQATPR